MADKNKIDFIKDNLDKLSDTKVDEIVELLEKACIPRKAFSVDVKIDTDDDFMVIDESGNEVWNDFEFVKYFDTENECFDWLTNFAKNSLKWRYEDKKPLVNRIQKFIVKMAKKRDWELYMSGNQTIDIEISKSLNFS